MDMALQDPADLQEHSCGASVPSDHYSSCITVAVSLSDTIALDAVINCIQRYSDITASNASLSLMTTESNAIGKRLAEWS